MLTELTAVKDIWTEYCKELYNHKITTDQNLQKEIKNTQPLLDDWRNDNDLLIEDVVQAIGGLKKRKALVLIIFQRNCCKLEEIMYIGC